MKATILFIINVFIFANILAKDHNDLEDSKRYTKTVKSSSDFELEITNKHGNITVENWDKDSVYVEVVVTVKASKEDQLKNMLYNTNIDFSLHADYLSVTTEWNDASKGIKNNVLKIFGEQTVKVEYKIKAPLTISIDIENKYGNILMENFDGELKLDLSHGNINVRKISNLKSIKLKYGKLKARSIEKGDIYARFSKIRIDNIGNVEFDCASTEIEIEKADKLIIKSLTDEIEIEEANYLEINSTFSDLEIGVLKKSIKGNVKHGNINIELVKDSFSGISLTTQNVDIELNFTQNSSFKYFVQLEKGESFIIPTIGNNFISDDFTDNIHRYSGTFSKEKFKENSPKINIVAKRSFVQFDVD